MDRTFCSGPGWRLGYSSTALLYPALIGTDDWAIELSYAELADFCRLLYQLADNMQQMKSELMSEEQIDCEVETELLWMQVSGLPSSYSLRLLQVAIAFSTAKIKASYYYTRCIPARGFLYT